MLGISKQNTFSRVYNQVLTGTDQNDLGNLKFQFDINDKILIER